MSPTKRAVKRDTKDLDVDLDQVGDIVDAWYALKRQAALIATKLNDGKTTLKDMVTRHGETDPTNGNIFLRLSKPVGDQRITTLKNQMRDVPSTNYERAEEILRKKGLWESMTTTKTVTVTELDPDAIFAGFYDGKLTENELDQMFPRNISYSFILLDDNDKPVS